MSPTASARALESQRLRAFAANLGSHPALSSCGAVIPAGTRGSANEVRLRVVACRKWWLCATCGLQAAAREFHRMRAIAQRWTTAGGSLAMLTLTQRHSLQDALSDLWPYLEAGWRSVTRGSGWLADRRDRGLAGYIRVTEVVHNERTGWSPHFHVCLFIDDVTHLADLADSIIARFVRGVTLHGGRAEAHCQQLALFPRGREEALASYCSKGTTMRRSDDGSRTPLAILDDLRVTGEGLDLWREVAAEVVAKKRRHVSCSTRIGELRARNLVVRDITSLSDGADVKHPNHDVLEKGRGKVAAC